MNTDLTQRKMALKEKISSLEQQEYNINKMLKVLNDPDFDTYTFTIEASKETDGFRDKQTVKFFDFSTLPQALSKAMPAHLTMISELLEDVKAELDDVNKQEQQESNNVSNEIDI